MTAEGFLKERKIKDTLYQKGSWIKGGLSKLMEAYRNYQNKELIELQKRTKNQRDEYFVRMTKADHQNKELINKAERLMLKYFGFTEDGGIIAEKQLKIFEIIEQLKKIK